MDASLGHVYRGAMIWSFLQYLSSGTVLCRRLPGPKTVPENGSPRPPVVRSDERMTSRGNDCDRALFGNKTGNLPFGGKFGPPVPSRNWSHRWPSVNTNLRYLKAKFRSERVWTLQPERLRSSRRHTSPRKSTCTAVRQQSSWRRR